MKLLNYNADLQLFERMKSLENEPHDSWRAIHISLSGREGYTAPLRLHFFVQPLRDMLADHDGYIYVLESGDIIVLFQGQLKPVIEMLNARFSDIADAEEEDMFTVYDLSLYWQMFYDLCERQANQVMRNRIKTGRRTPELLFRATQEAIQQ